MNRILLMTGVCVVLAQAQTDALLTYRDPRNRFEFSYPASFGSPAPGADSGFRSRLAAVRFRAGGEAVLTTEAPQFDLQAAGGLYDAITLQIFPESTAKVIREALPVLNAGNFCDAIGRERHLRAADRALAPLAAAQRAGIESVDRMGNYESRVLWCEVMGSTVIFDKVAAASAGGPVNHIYGAVRFLQAPYSSFQLIARNRTQPADTLLRSMTALVDSWRPL